MKLTRLAELLGSKKLTYTRLADRTGVLLNVDGMSVYTLNETGLVIVETVAGGVVDAEKLALRLVQEFEVTLETAQRDVKVFVDGLCAHIKVA